MMIRGHEYIQIMLNLMFPVSVLSVIFSSSKVIHLQLIQRKTLKYYLKMAMEDKRMRELEKDLNNGSPFDMTVYKSVIDDIGCMGFSVADAIEGAIVCNTTFNIATITDYLLDSDSNKRQRYGKKKQEMTKYKPKEKSQEREMEKRKEAQREAQRESQRKAQREAEKEREKAKANIEKIDKIEMNGKIGMSLSKSSFKKMNWEESIAFVKSHHLLYGRYLEKDGTVSDATHATYKFDENDFDGSRMIRYWTRKDIKQQICNNSSQKTLVKEGIDGSKLQAKVQMAAFGGKAVCGISGDSSNNAVRMQNNNKNQSKLTIITRRDTSYGKIKLTSDCLKYTHQFKMDLLKCVQLTKEKMVELKELNQVACAFDNQNNYNDDNKDSKDSKDKKDNKDSKQTYYENVEKQVLNIGKLVYYEWERFWKKYGHFIITSAIIGGTLYMETEIETNDEKEIENIKKNNKKAFSIEGKANPGWSMLGSIDGNVGYNNNNENNMHGENINMNKNIDSTLQCIGGNPNLASLNSVDLWENSLINDYLSWDMIKMDNIEEWHEWMTNDLIVKECNCSMQDYIAIKEYVTYLQRFESCDDKQEFMHDNDHPLVPFVSKFENDDIESDNYDYDGNYNDNDNENENENDNGMEYAANKLFGFSPANLAALAQEQPNNLRGIQRHRISNASLLFEPAFFP